MRRVECTKAVEELQNFFDELEWPAMMREGGGTVLLNMIYLSGKYGTRS